jgi:mRNA-degrading endonuclease toxin of MazEF toxin-antitoxin module
MKLHRGGIWYIHFPYTFDVNYPNGKNKFVLVLQEGAIFRDYDAVTVLLITTDQDCKDYDTNVTIECGTTRMASESYAVCAQPYTILKSYFEINGVWCAGKLSPEKLDEVDTALYTGLCMGVNSQAAIEAAYTSFTGTIN